MVFAAATCRLEFITDALNGVSTRTPPQRHRLFLHQIGVCIGHNTQGVLICGEERLWYGCVSSARHPRPLMSRAFVLPGGQGRNCVYTRCCCGSLHMPWCWPRLFREADQPQVLGCEPGWRGRCHDVRRVLLVSKFGFSYPSPNLADSCMQVHFACGDLAYQVRPGLRQPPTQPAERPSPASLRHIVLLWRHHRGLHPGPGRTHHDVFRKHRHGAEGPRPGACPGARKPAAPCLPPSALPTAACCLHTMLAECAPKPPRQLSQRTTEWVSCVCMKCI
jgi:hypothetical protein